MVVTILQGVIAELLALIYPYMYWKYVVIGKNINPILYVKLPKGLV